VFKSFEFTDKDLYIYNKEIKDYIPDIIIDSHIHSWKKSHIIYDYNFNNYKLDKPFKDLNLIDEFIYKDFQKYMNIVFPSKKYYGMFFGLPFLFIDTEKNNNFHLINSTINNYNFLYVTLPEEDIWKTDKSKNFLNNKNFLGFKPYPDLCKLKSDEISIFDFVNRSVLEFAEENSLFILLHLPRKRGLGDQKNISEIVKILKQYKKLKIILAHAGRAYCVKDIIDKLDVLKKFDNLFFDLALVSEVSVIEYVLKKINVNNIFYGSDNPWLLIKGKDVFINDNHYYISNKLYDWSLGPKESVKTDFTLYAYEQIRALIYAINTTRPRCFNKYMNKIFYENFNYFL